MRPCFIEKLWSALKWIWWVFKSNEFDNFSFPTAYFFTRQVVAAFGGRRSNGDARFQLRFCSQRQRQRTLRRRRRHGALRRNTVPLRPPIGSGNAGARLCLQSLATWLNPKRGPVRFTFRLIPVSVYSYRSSFNKTGVLYSFMLGNRQYWCESIKEITESESSTKRAIF